MESKTKIDELIEYFEHERKLLSDRHEERENFNQYTLSIGLTACTCFVVVVAALINLFFLIAETRKFIPWLISLPFIFLLFSFGSFLYTGYQNDKRYKKVIYYDVILDFLWHLKVSRTKIDLQPLINRVDLDWHDKRRFQMKVKDYEKIRLEEFFKIINEINNKIIQQINKKIILSSPLASSA